MKTIQILKNDNEAVICSLTEYPEGIRGISADGYTVVVDGNELINPAENQQDSFDEGRNSVGCQTKMICIIFIESMEFNMTKVISEFRANDNLVLKLDAPLPMRPVHRFSIDGKIYDSVPISGGKMDLENWDIIAVKENKSLIGKEVEFL